jgi:mRNA-degrading endonuclease RelE of RelBE toxin-antitoxin system
MAHRIEYSRLAREHISVLKARQRVIVLHEVDAQLVHQPTIVTRNRKRLQPNFLARFELRVGDLRVYYEVDERAALVEIRAVGVKKRSKVLIGGEEVDLA